MDILHLEDRLDWDLVKKVNLTAKAQNLNPYGVKSINSTPIRYIKKGVYNHKQLAPLSYLIESRIVAIGLNIPSNNPHYYNSNCFASMKLRGNTSSTSKYQDGMLVHRQQIILDELNIIQFPHLTISPYYLEITFARWVNQINLEVWKYIGIDTTSDIQALQQIQNTVNQISVNQNNNPI